MQSGFLKELRFPIAMLFVVVLAASVVAVTRERLELALTKVEGLIVAKLMLDLPGDASPDNIGYHDPNKHGADYPRTQGEQHEWWEKEAIRADVIKAVPKAAAIDQSGQYIVAQSLFDPDKPLPPGTDTAWPWGFVYKVPMAGGGWLRIETGQPTEKRFRAELEEHEKHREGWWEKNEPLNPAPVGHRMYYVEASISEPAGERTPLAVKPVRLVFTNIEEQEDDSLNHFSVPGEIRAHYLLAGSGLWVGPMTKAEIGADILQTCRAWGVTTPSHNDAYLSLRSMFERQETSLPLLNVSVASDSFLLWSFAIAIALAAWVSFLLRGAQRHTPPAEGEPWILVEPFRQICQVPGCDLIPAVLELFLFVGFHIVALAAPLLVGAILILWGSSNDHKVRWDCPRSMEHWESARTTNDARSEHAVTTRPNTALERTAHSAGSVRMRGSVPVGRRSVWALGLLCHVVQKPHCSDVAQRCRHDHSHSCRRGGWCVVPLVAGHGFSFGSGLVARPCVGGHTGVLCLVDIAPAQMRPRKCTRSTFSHLGCRRQNSRCCGGPSLQDPRWHPDCSCDQRRPRYRSLPWDWKIS